MDIGKTAGSVGSGALGVWLSLWTWLQYDFAPWFSKLWVMVVLWAITIGAALVGLVFDASYAGNLAPSADLVPVYEWAGRIISMAGVFLLSLSVLAFRNKAHVTGAIVLVMWIMVVSASVMHSVGIIARTIDERYAQVQLVTADQVVRVDAKADVLAELRAQRTALETQRDAIKAEFRASINAIADDDVAGISASDARTIENLEQTRDEQTRPIDAKIEALNAQILSRISDTTSEEAIAQSSYEEPAFDPLYILLGRFLHGEEVTDAQITQIAIRVSSYWAALIPFLGLLVSILFNFHLHMAERQQDEKARIEKKAKDLLRGRKAADTKKKNANTHDAEYEEVAPLPVEYIRPDNDDEAEPQDDELENEPLDEDPDIEPQDIEDDDDNDKQRPQAAE